ncbi:MAG: hypothetical protein K8F91_25785, partial [Candidatus Obscuribacterales bacterium]|nr:hypothetical protein [Candidatus Obscuribacterales bacterium]
MKIFTDEFQKIPKSFPFFELFGRFNRSSKYAVEAVVMRFGTLLKTESDQSGQRNLVLNRHWREFEEQFETEADCLEALFARLEERARCANCSGQSFDRAYGSRQMECLHCGRKVRLTAGTFFHRKKCLRAWLAAIWLMERGVPLNAS